ncbi:Alpha/Beta hydrolase protein [Xylariomycetidae sp. FL2044]|nr:Alpha/Beta hydrolase protein [Xylariomycetidae sp. FL2044]
MLPSTPSLSFTLPSIHDDTKLDCRIYHPVCLHDALSSSSRWRRHAAIVAHPYAPLGGSYDDPIVDLVGGTLLQVGFLVATFNFRGASSHGGRTSWTSKPELADYMSITGFLAFYLHYLDLPHARPSPLMNETETETIPPPTMILAGYSYGAMITSKLPPLENILSNFVSPAIHTPAADIRLRAQHLAEQQNALFAAPMSPRRSLGYRMGGDQETPRKSADGSRARHHLDPEERIRKGVKELLARTRLIRKRRAVTSSTDEHEGAHEGAHEDDDYLAEVVDLTTFGSAYILVSPPFGFVTNLATMSFANPFSSWSRKANSRVATRKVAADNTEREQSDADVKLIRNPSLLVYGDEDTFLSLRRIREWTKQLGTDARSQCRSVEVVGAGHFWMEEGVLYDLGDAIGRFAKKLL